MKTDLKDIPLRTHKRKFTARMKGKTRVPASGPLNRAQRRALDAIKRVKR